MKRTTSKLLVLLVFISLLGTVGFQNYYAEPTSAMESDTQEIGSDVSTEMGTELSLAEPVLPITDLSSEMYTILTGTTGEFIGGYLVDEAFLMWIDAQYGDETVSALAERVREQNFDTNIWYELTGQSIHVLWLEYCQTTGFQSYQTQDVYWKSCKSSSEILMSFAGDINFADDWFVSDEIAKQGGNIRDFFSQDLLSEMDNSDLFLINNEFVYSDRGTPTVGKAYTFRAAPQKVEWLNALGADIVSLANNHVFDYGEEGLADTMKYLDEETIPYVGAGSNLGEASKIVYYIMNGRKIAIVSATQIERTNQQTREATETESGVLKTLDPSLFAQVIAKAKENSDYVIAVVHWGSEGNVMYENSQKQLAEIFVRAGADAVIGGHPHRLQGVSYIDGVPIAYSLGNYWFSDGTLYTTLAQVTIDEQGTLKLSFLPCEQTETGTRLLTDESEKSAFYNYVASISTNAGIDADGCFYDMTALEYQTQNILYDSLHSTSPITGRLDNMGNAIDIVGNLSR